jgi:hypothetical protein
VRASPRGDLRPANVLLKRAGSAKFLDVGPAVELRGYGLPVVRVERRFDVAEAALPDNEPRPQRRQVVEGRGGVAGAYPPLGPVARAAVVAAPDADRVGLPRPRTTCPARHTTWPSPGGRRTARARYPITPTGVASGGARSPFPTAGPPSVQGFRAGTRGAATRRQPSPSRPGSYSSQGAASPAAEGGEHLQHAVAALLEQREQRQDRRAEHIARGPPTASLVR